MYIDSFSQLFVRFKRPDSFQKKRDFFSFVASLLICRLHEVFFDVRSHRIMTCNFLDMPYG